MNLAGFEGVWVGMEEAPELGLKGSMPPPMAWEGYVAAVCVFVVAMIIPAFGRSGPVSVVNALIQMSPYFLLAFAAAVLGGLGILKGGRGHRLVALIACVLGIVVFVNVFHAFMYVTYLE